MKFEGNVLQELTLTKSVLYVTGLPRSGSTLLCQLLDMHPEIHSDGHSSPLQGILQTLRHQISNNDFLLSQMDVDFDKGYKRLQNLNRGLMNGWFAGTDKEWVVDKNRGWLMHIDLVQALDPNFRMLVCIRDPAQIYGSIEARHQQTLLLDFPDNLASLTRYARADKLFSADGVIGAPLKAIEALQDIPKGLQDRLFYVVFEHLMQEPEKVLKSLYEWLQLPVPAFDPTKLPVKPHESDSYYRFKYPHKTRSQITPPATHDIPSRILSDIRDQFSGIYNIFYPGVKKK